MQLPCAMQHPEHLLPLLQQNQGVLKELAGLEGSIFTALIASATSASAGSQLGSQ
jgi:hypothetical protein